MKKKIFYIFIIGCLLVLPIQFVFSNNTDRFAKGPLIGKNQLISYLIHLCLPPATAASLGLYNLRVSTILHITNDFTSYKLNYTNGNSKFRAALDVETYALYYGLEFGIFRNIDLGFRLPLIFHISGFLDPYIDGFHDFFGMNHAGRPFFEHYNVFVNIRNNNNILLELDGHTYGLGDAEIWLKWQFLKMKYVKLGALWDLKLPTGSIQKLTGSSFLDFGFALLTDIHPVWFFSMYLNNGLVIPNSVLFLAEKKSTYPMYQGNYCFEFCPLSVFSVLIQFNFISPAYSSLQTLYINYPLLNLLVGTRIRWENFIFQFYFEEDIDLVGADFTINFAVEYVFKLRR